MPDVTKKTAVKLEKESTASLVPASNKIIYQWIITEPFNAINSARLFNFNTLDMDGNSGVLLYIKGNGLFVYMSYTDGTPPTPDNINVFTVTPSGAPSPIGVIARVVNTYGALLETSSANINLPSIPVGSTFFVDDLMRFYGKWTPSQSMPLQTTFTVGTDAQYRTINDAITDIINIGTYDQAVIEIISDVTETVSTSFLNYFELTIICNVGHKITWNNCGLSWGANGGKCFLLGNFDNQINLTSITNFISCDASAAFDLNISCNTFFTSNSALGYLISTPTPQGNIKVTGGVHLLGNTNSMFVQSVNFRLLDAVLLISDTDGNILDIDDALLMDSVVFVIAGDAPATIEIVISSISCQMNNILIRVGGSDLSGRRIIFRAITILADTVYNPGSGAPLNINIPLELSTNALELTQSVGVTVNYKAAAPNQERCMVSNSIITSVMEVGTLALQQYSNCVMPSQQYGIVPGYRYMFNNCQFAGIALFDGSNHIVTACYSLTSNFNVVCNDSIFTSNQTATAIINSGTGNTIANNIVI